MKRFRQFKSAIGNRQSRIILAVLLGVAVVTASGFIEERLRVAVVGGVSYPTRTLYLNGTVTRSGNDATYTPTWGALDKTGYATDGYGADAGSTDTYAVTLSPAPASYITGARYRFKANTANTGAATINFNALGAKTIKKAAGGITTDLATNDIRAGQIVDLVYDGTNMQLQSGLGNAAASAEAPYKVYTAVVSQVANNAPVVVVLANTLGGTVVWSRTFAGTYNGTLSSAFTNDKTVVFITNGHAVNGAILCGERYDDGAVVLTSQTPSDGTYADSLMALATLEIRVYP